MEHEWTIAVPRADLVRELAARLRLSPLFARCLVNRGLTDPDAISRFIQPRLKDLSDPFLIPEMDQAVTRLFQARARGELVVLFGDYDVDGVTATAILTRFLRGLGWKVEYYLPLRQGEGYGLSRAGVENCAARFPMQLLVAVDCGSTSGESIGWLAARGVDVVVVDHHQVPEQRPPAVAMVNPQLAGAGDCCFRELCSAGLAFKLAHALLKRARAEGLEGAEEVDIREYLDLVALGTIADLVPLTGENRILVNCGLPFLERTARPGLVALKEVAKIGGKVGGYEVGFQLGPRLNAAGRLETALSALELVLSEDPIRAGKLAKQLDEQNQERQAVERAITTAVLEGLHARFDPAEDLVIVLGEAGWHVGVVGIVASRVVQEFYRPTLILGEDGPEWKGSGRSIAGFDLAAALRECDELLVRHGGHAMAAGVTIHPSNLDAFRRRINEVARGTLQPGQLIHPMRIDAEVTLGELTLERLRELEGLNETGMGNPRVQLVARRLRLCRPGQRMGREKQHVKLWVSDGTATCEVVWWAASERAWPEEPFDLVFVPQLNDFNGRVTVQLRLLDFRATG